MYISAYILQKKGGHNPYFNRWFSAIGNLKDFNLSSNDVTILILIDGFLQSHMKIS